MMAVLAALLQVALPAPARVHGIVRDAATGTPVASAQVTGPAAHAVTDGDGTFAVSAAAGDTLRIRRIGYAPVRVVVRRTNLPLQIALTPRAVSLPPTHVSSAGASSPASTTADVPALEQSAVRSTAEALERLPFVSARSSRGGVLLSMRGSRPEQVLVTLDGVPLNDPATGVADISDLPLAALGTITAIPGAAGATYGSGASGGVLALTTAARPVLSAYAGALGEAGGAAAYTGRAGAVALHAGGAWSRAVDDFRFLNDQTDPSRDERRVNNDLHEVALFGSVTTPALHAVALVTRRERGLVGPVNVRVFDNARGRTERGLAGVAWTAGAVTLRAAAHTFRADYHDPPSDPVRTTSQAYDLQADARWGAITTRAGLGADRVAGDHLHAPTRARGFAALARSARAGAWAASGAIRLDAIGGAGVQWSPVLRAAWSGPVRISLAWSQAFRAPTFFDLYFASPQRVTAAPSLRPERVTTDAELAVAWQRNSIGASLSAFARHTRDAIVWFPGTFEWSPTNAARERVHGVEARAHWSGARTQLELWGALRSTRLRTREGARVPTPYVPAADGGASARVDVRHLSLSAALRVIGRRPFVVVPDPPPDRQLPAVALVDAAAAWPLDLWNAHATLTVGVRNIGNVNWQSVVGYPNARRTWTAGFTVQP